MLDTAFVYLAMLYLKIIARISNHDDDDDDEMEINTIEVMLSFFVVAFYSRHSSFLHISFHESHFSHSRYKDTVERGYFCN